MKKAAARSSPSSVQLFFHTADRVGIAAATERFRFGLGFSDAQGISRISIGRTRPPESVKSDKRKESVIVEVAGGGIPNARRIAEFMGKITSLTYSVPIRCSVPGFLPYVNRRNAPASRARIIKYSLIPPTAIIRLRTARIIPVFIIYIPFNVSRGVDDSIGYRAVAVVGSDGVRPIERRGGLGSGSNIRISDMAAAEERIFPAPLVQKAEGLDFTGRGDGDQAHPPVRGR